MHSLVLRSVLVALSVAVGLIAFTARASAGRCGGNNQRACCVGEAKFGACKPGYRQKAKRKAGKCGNSIFQAAGICVRKAKEPTRVVKHCGARNERACCVGETTFGACARGLHEVPKRNAGWCKGARVQSMGICIPNQRQVCGGLGQRACCVGEGVACHKGLIQVAGCNGDCKCPIGFSNGMCSERVSRIPEPSIGWTPPRQASRGLRGFADLHMHMFAHLAHGGKVLSGLPSHPRGVSSALASCRGKHAFPHLMVANNASTIGHGTNDMHALKPRNVDSWGGAPLFNGWPTWRSTIHQQVYYKWLERAWRGGLRLMVEHAVSNEALCQSTKGIDCRNSMISIEKQIMATRAMEKYIARRGGWFKIVRSPAEARKVIGAGKLAVVQGIEVDNLFDCKLNSKKCSNSYLRKQIKKYWAMGVRHIFPIHNFDNLFGGPATWQDVIEVGNKAVEGAWWRTQQCPAGYGFKLGEQDVTKFIALMFGFKQIGRMPKHPGTTTCNARGLSSEGRYLINKLMDVGMIIDVDHMSNKSLNETLGLSSRRSPSYPLVASHVQFFDLNHQSIRHERMRTKAQLERIAASGGMIAAMLKDDFQDTGNIGRKFQKRYGRYVPDNCRHSSKTWAQMLQYAVDVMKAPVAMGSDFNGVAGHVGPRFGSDACGGDANEQRAQRKRLRYPFTVPGFGSFKKQVSGFRTFDFNHDGLAHVGLLPDLVADVERIGLPQSYIDKLMGSAEKYIQVWERALRARKSRK